MALPRRAPREVYKVYSESDFIGGADAGEMFPSGATAGEGRRERRRLAGPATLAGVLVAIVALLLIHRPLGQSPRQPIPRAGGARGVHVAKRVPRTLAPPALAPGTERRPIASGRHRTSAAATAPIASVASSVRGASREADAAPPGAVPPPEVAEFGFER